MTTRDNLNRGMLNQEGMFNRLNHLNKLDHKGVTNWLNLQVEANRCIIKDNLINMAMPWWDLNALV